MRAPFIALAAALAATTLAAARAEPPAPLPGADDADPRAALEKWVETRRLVSREHQDWQLGRELLDDRIQLLRREVESLRAKTAEAEAGIGEADTKLAELRAQNDALKAATAGMDAAVAALEARVRALLARLPEPIRERVKPLSQSLPKDSAATTTLGLGQRFQNVVGILNEVNKFSRELAVAAEVRTLPDGTSAEVTVLYLGLAQAYYCNANGAIAGLGRPGTNGWVWTQDNTLAPAVADTLAVYRNEKPATYVPLPLEIQ